eukprot:1146285-Pelagomonas_calceolata.AAC.3
MACRHCTSRRSGMKGHLDAISRSRGLLILMNLGKSRMAAYSYITLAYEPKKAKHDWSPAKSKHLPYA